MENEIRDGIIDSAKVDIFPIPDLTVVFKLFVNLIELVKALSNLNACILDNTE